MMRSCILGYGNDMNRKRTRDYAVVGVYDGNIFLEANEWNVSAGEHYVVTLLLEPDEALQVAEQIRLCAIGMQDVGG